MKSTKMLAILVLLLASVANGSRYLTVNNQQVASITLELGQSRTIEVVSTDSTSYVDYVGFDNGAVLGDFSHLETKPEAGDRSDVVEVNQPAFYGYYVNATGISQPPSAGVHFVFQYEALQLGETDLKLYQNNPPPSAGPLLDSVQITVIPLSPKPIGTAFTYQGRLIDANDVADGLYDLQFKLYDNADPVFAVQQGSTIDINDLDVIDGYFTVELDFGSDVFAGDARWLQIGVRPGDSNDTNDFVTLSPRQEVTPAPYAIYAGYAETAGGIPGGISGSGTADYIAKFTGPNTLGDSVIYEEAGNVGIGTTNASVDLEVSGTLRVSYPSDLTKGLEIQPYSGAPRINIRNMQPGFGLNIVKNGVTSLMFLKEDGNVGIGTTSPAAKLEVNGEIKITDGSQGAGKVLTSDASGLASWQTPAAGGDNLGNHIATQNIRLNGHWLSGDGGNEGVFVNNTGKIGIGTTNPSYRLDVSGDIRTTGDLYVGNNEIRDTDGDSRVSMYSYALIFRNSEGTGRMRMTDAGDVGIGTAGPGDKLDVAGHINSSESYKLDGQTVVSNTGTNNILVGQDAGASVTTGGYNSAMGDEALRSNTTGNGNSAMGERALYSNTEGHFNSAMGCRALYWNTAGGYNSAMGNYALSSNTTGNENLAVGNYALYSNTTGNSNLAVGHVALRNNTEGYNNSAVGYWAGYYNSTGSGNVFLGYKAGYYETGDNKLYIDNSLTSTPLIYGDFATNRIGINRVPTTNTFEVGGNASKTTAGGWLANSDERIKADIQTVTNALETLDKVRLVSFRYSDDYQAKHASIEKRRYLNVIAQEFREVFPEYVKSSKEKLTNGEEILQVDAYPLTVYSAAAVQELHEIAKAKDAEIAGLKERISRIEAVLAKLAREQEGGRR